MRALCLALPRLPYLRGPSLFATCLVCACNSGPTPVPSPTGQDAGPERAAKLSFVERLASVPKASQASWVLRQLRENNFREEAQTPPWSSFQSECDFRLKIQVPSDRAMPRRKERRPGRRYAPNIDEHSQSVLLWSSSPNNDPSFALIRSVEDASSEAFVRRGKTLWTKRDQEAWSERPVDDDFHLRWAWEHRRCIWDVLALAGPALELRTQNDAPEHQLKFTVGLRAGQPAKPTAPQPTSPRSAWRAHARVLSLSGTLTLDKGSGAWMAADLESRFSVSTPETKPFEGSAVLSARAGPVDAAKLTWPTIQTPIPLPGPPRYHNEQRRLLRGLAPGGGAGLGTLR